MTWIFAQGVDRRRPTLVQGLRFGLAMALFSTVLPVFWQSAAVRHIGAARTVLIGTLGPILTILFGWLLLAEPVSLAQLAGAGLVAAWLKRGQLTKPARLFTTAKGTKVVRSLDPGMMLYPTGNKDGMMWEVEDELGNKGWVSSSLVQLAR